MNVLIILGVFTLIGVLFGVLLKLVAIKKLSCVRSFTKTAVFEGETGEMVEVVSNHGDCNAVRQANCRISAIFKLAEIHTVPVGAIRL